MIAADPRLGVPLHSLSLGDGGAMRFPDPVIATTSA